MSFNRGNRVTGRDMKVMSSRFLTRGSFPVLFRKALYASLRVNSRLCLASANG